MVYYQILLTLLMIVAVRGEPPTTSTLTIQGATASPLLSANFKPAIGLTAVSPSAVPSLTAHGPFAVMTYSTAAPYGTLVSAQPLPATVHGLLPLVGSTAVLQDSVPLLASSYTKATPSTNTTRTDVRFNQGYASPVTQSSLYSVNFGSNQGYSVPSTQSSSYSNQASSLNLNQGYSFPGAQSPSYSIRMGLNQDTLTPGLFYLGSESSRNPGQEYSIPSGQTASHSISQYYKVPNQEFFQPPTEISTNFVHESSKNSNQRYPATAAYLLNGYNQRLSTPVSYSVNEPVKGYSVPMSYSVNESVKSVHSAPLSYTVNENIKQYSAPSPYSLNESRKGFNQGYSTPSSKNSSHPVDVSSYMSSNNKPSKPVSHSSSYQIQSSTSLANAPPRVPSPQLLHCGHHFVPSLHKQQFSLFHPISSNSYSIHPHQVPSAHAAHSDSYSDNPFFQSSHIEIPNPLSFLNSFFNPPAPAHSSVLRGPDHSPGYYSAEHDPSSSILRVSF